MSQRITAFRAFGRLYRISLIEKPKRRQVVKVFDPEVGSGFKRNGRADNWRKVLDIDLTCNFPLDIEEIKERIKEQK